MSDFHVNVVRITNVTNHPNADRLDIINVHDGFPCIVQREQFKVGDLAIYVPIETILPEKHFESYDPKDRKHLRAKKIRGIFSMGILIPNVGNWNEGQDVAQELCVTRFEPKEEIDVNGYDEPAPQHFIFPKYTDIENLRRYQNVFNYNEEVILHEKIDGENSRFTHDGNRLWVGSHTRIKKDLSNLEEFKINSKWWRIAKQYDFENKLAKYPNKIFYGELYGCVKSLKYGLNNDIQFMLFDVFDLSKQKYIDYDFALDIANDLNIPWVPEIYRGPWTRLQEFIKYADGNSLLHGASNIREGFVMRPITERWNETLGRVIVKLHGEQYLLLKNKRIDI